MDNSLADGILTVCNVLNKHSVQYMIVGGTAVALHGYFRGSINLSGLPANKLDFDFWYNPTYDNYFRLLNALEELEQDISEFKEEKAPNPRKSFFKLEFEKFTLDFLPELNGLSRFSLSFKEKETVDMNETQIYFLSYDDLIASNSSKPFYTPLSDIITNKKVEIHQVNE